MSSLHQLMSADPRAVRDCLAFLRKGDEVLLLDAGTHLLNDTAAIKELLSKSEKSIGISVLLVDARSRGLEAQAGDAGFELISDAQWVERVFTNSKVLSWK